MNEAGMLSELLKRIEGAKSGQFFFRPRKGKEAWKDIALVRARLDLDREEVVGIIKSLTAGDCYKDEASLDPKKPARKFFFRILWENHESIEIELFIKMASPETYIIDVDSFHESNMPSDVVTEEAEKLK